MCVCVCVCVCVCLWVYTCVCCMCVCVFVCVCDETVREHISVSIHLVRRWCRGAEAAQEVRCEGPGNLE
jgi:hypothetical protein